MLSEILRFPVKSMGGESLGEVEVTKRGLDKDRTWAVVDAESGLVASAKHSNRWGRLLELSAYIDDEGELSILGPTGQVSARLAPQDLDQMLRDHLTRSVQLRHVQEVAKRTLERADPDPESLLEGREPELGPVTTGPLGTAAPEGTLFDFAPIHIVSTATLAALEQLGGPSAGDARRFRPNLVVDIDGPPFQENDWPGRQLVFDGGVCLDVTVQSPRCIVPSLAQGELGRSVETLRAVAQNNRMEIDGFGTHSCVGAYASVSVEGLLQRGCVVRLS